MGCRLRVPGWHYSNCRRSQFLFCFYTEYATLISVEAHYPVLFLFFPYKSITDRTRTVNRNVVALF